MSNKNDSNMMIRYSDVLKDYMKASNVDYAYMLTGNWGCGKTFFLRHMLKKDFETENYKIVHVSLYGKDSIEQVNMAVLSQLSSFSSIAASIKGKIKKSTDSGYTNFYIATASLISDLYFWERLGNCDKKHNILFIFDDVERCKKDIVIDLFGAIHTSYSEKGHHVLFVADENKLIDYDGKYKERKEKIIRTTIEFKYLNFPKMIEDLINLRPDTPSYSLLKEKHDNLLDFVEYVKSIDNLRTWICAFDYYDYVCEKCVYDNSYPHILTLFIIILISTHYIKTNLDVLEGDVSRLKEKLKKDFNIEYVDLSLYGRDFKITYQEHYLYKFSRISSLLNYIKTGYLDVTETVNAMENNFPVGSASEIAFSKIHDYHSLSKEELHDCLLDIENGIDNCEYALERLVSISRFFEILDRDGYLILYGKVFVDYRTFISSSITKLDKEKVKSFYDPDIRGESDYQRYKKKPNYLEPLLDTLHNKYFNPNKNKEEFVEVFSKIGDYTYSELPYVVKNEMFKKINEYDLFDRFLSFRCSDIERICSYIEIIIRQNKDYSFFVSEIEPMEKLKGYIESNLGSIPSNKKKIELECLVRVLSYSIKKISNTQIEVI